MCIFFQLGNVWTTLVTAIVVIGSYHLIHGPVPEGVNLLTFGGGQHFEFQSLLAVSASLVVHISPFTQIRFAIPVLSVFCSQLLLALINLLGFADKISQHPDGSKLLLLGSTSALSAAISPS
eukprot:Blabericola_migrator_1__8181@NODE_422_length_8656_cov_28_186285_g334_i0_p12_GENE_NODE_422_length_8656_cov_28_186285_g334_i0NODE_422_length_8656_cov_28_186285_g334_i0_p12_ORF_typecomplete_len122_score4_77_NODE_422_length_8656_cov_28_186285_g334_i058316196